MKIITCAYIALSLYTSIIYPSETLEEEYTPAYCSMLEDAYGKNMMSEGGADGICHMFSDISLDNKVALDIGSGLGGVAFYLAERHSMQITGLEINPWMVAESEKRTQDALKGKINFVFNTNNGSLPFSDNHFDVIYSKGVLTHLESKEELFNECYRLLKDDGLLVITDWLSSDIGKWGSHMGKLIELEHLSIYPESEKDYVSCLEKSRFKIVSVRDDSTLYRDYNMGIAESLRTARLELLTGHEDRAAMQASIEGYESIAKAIEVGELRVIRFVAKKGNL